MRGRVKCFNRWVLVDVVTVSRHYVEVRPVVPGPYGGFTWAMARESRALRLI